jgi:hypothetical protein
MSNAELYASARALARVIDGIDDTSWGNLTCSEADTFADFLLAVGDEDAAASLIFRHSHADEADDGHAEIGAAWRAQAERCGIAWEDRLGYRLALAYVRELS